MPSEHAALLKDSVTDFTSRATSIARVRALRGTPGEYDRAIWRQMAGLGWLGIGLPERHAAWAGAHGRRSCEGLAPPLRPSLTPACAFSAAGVIAARE